MSILGTLIDKATHSFDQKDGDGVNLTTLAHNLPATNPEAILAQVVSVEAVGGNGANGMPLPIGLGGNASLATIGIGMASSPSVPVLTVNYFSIVWHTIVR